MEKKTRTTKKRMKKRKTNIHWVDVCGELLLHLAVVPLMSLVLAHRAVEVE